MKKFLAVAVMVGLCAFFTGCQKKAEDPAMVEEAVVIEEVEPAQEAPTPAPVPAEEAPAEGE
jgi:hypothetical protein